MEENKLYNKYGIVIDSGKILFREDEIGDKMYIIQSGNVRISKLIGGKEHILAVLGKGDFFGEMAIVNRVARTATATAVDTVHLLSFNRQGFISMIEKNSRIALNIIDKLCRRLQQANMQIQFLAKKNEKALIAMNLYYAFSEKGMEKAVLDFHKVVRDLSISLEFPQENIIGYFEELKNGKIIRIEENNLYLDDKEQLAVIVDRAGKT